METLDKSVKFNLMDIGILYLYTFNFSTKKIEESILKIIGDQVLINFDNNKTSPEDLFCYVGTIKIATHAIFIKTTSEKYDDECLIILLNKIQTMEKEYNKDFFSLGRILSQSRTRMKPEGKLIFAKQKQLDDVSLKEYVKSVLSKPQLPSDFFDNVAKYM